MYHDFYIDISKHVIILSLLDMIFHCMDAANQIVMNGMEKELYIVLNS